MHKNAEYVRLSGRIADLKRRILEEEEGAAVDGLQWLTPVQIEILELLKKTLKDLEARKDTWS